MWNKSLVLRQRGLAAEGLAGTSEAGRVGSNPL